MGLLSPPLPGRVYDAGSDVGSAGGGAKPEQVRAGELQWKQGKPRVLTVQHVKPPAAAVPTELGLETLPQGTGNSSSGSRGRCPLSPTNAGWLSSLCVV